MVARTGWFVLRRDCGQNGVRLTIIPDYAIVYSWLGEEANQSDMQSFIDNGIAEKHGPRDHCKRRRTHNPGVVARFDKMG